MSYDLTLSPTLSPTSTIVDCSSSYSCDSSDLYCTGLECEINCNGMSSCESSTIYCDGHCLINCTNEGSCQEANITPP